MSAPKRPDWQERLFDEHKELSARLDKLMDFVSPHNDKFVTLPVEDRRLLLQQLDAMFNYYSVLSQRIFRLAGAA